LVEKLVEKGHAYETAQAVYFDIVTYPRYTALSRQSLEDKLVGARDEVQEDPEKRHPADFALWFKAVGRFENHLMRWDSPWGVGFPGWHIECSAMAIEYLGDSLDIHCGGIDHIPVHHTNEIAQSEGALGHKWVNYWIHGEFLVVDNGKMSKSSGDFLTLNKLIKDGFDPLVYRYYVLQSKYRKPLSFSYNRLRDSSKSLDSIKKGILFATICPYCMLFHYLLDLLFVILDIFCLLCILTP